jgi:hypothetical protein
MPREAASVRGGLVERRFVSEQNNPVCTFIPIHVPPFSSSTAQTTPLPLRSHGLVGRPATSSRL